MDHEDRNVGFVQHMVRDAAHNACDNKWGAVRAHDDGVGRASMRLVEQPLAYALMVASNSNEVCSDAEGRLSGSLPLSTGGNSLPAIMIETGSASLRRSARDCGREIHAVKLFGI